MAVFEHFLGCIECNPRLEENFQHASGFYVVKIGSNAS
jgi:hypothetical protein